VDQERRRLAKRDEGRFERLMPGPTAREAGGEVRVSLEQGVPNGVDCRQGAENGVRQNDAACRRMVEERSKTHKIRGRATQLDDR